MCNHDPTLPDTLGDHTYLCKAKLAPCHAAAVTQALNNCQRGLEPLHSQRICLLVGCDLPKNTKSASLASAVANLTGEAQRALGVPFGLQKESGLIVQSSQPAQRLDALCGIPDTLVNLQGLVVLGERALAKLRSHNLVGDLGTLGLEDNALVLERRRLRGQVPHRLCQCQDPEDPRYDAGAKVAMCTDGETCPRSHRTTAFLQLSSSIIYVVWSYCHAARRSRHTTHDSVHAVQAGVASPSQDAPVIVGHAGAHLCITSCIHPGTPDVAQVHLAQGHAARAPAQQVSTRMQHAPLRVCVCR